MSDIWGTVNAGFDLGSEQGRRLRNRRAYQDGGLTGVEQAAGGAGDLETMENVRGMQRRERAFNDDREEQAFRWFEQNAPYARNVLRATRNMPPERAQAFFQQPQVRQRFQQMGFSTEQIDAAVAGLTNPDQATREQWFNSLDQSFTQHENPDWRLVGNQAVALDPQNGQIQLGGKLPEDVSTGRYATPDEVAQAGYRAGTVVWITPGEAPRVIQAPTMYRPRQSGGDLEYPDDGYDYEGG